MLTYIATAVLILALMLAGIAVDRLYRGFARRHPELGPYRTEGGACGGRCGGGGCGGACDGPDT